MSETKVTKNKLFLNVLVALTLVIGILPFLSIPSEKTLGITAFLGRFHPLILHFPIVLVLLLTALEVWKLIKGESLSNAKLTTSLLVLASISCFATVLAGYFLYRNGEYQGEMVENHFWGGIIIGISLNIAIYFYWTFQKGRKTTAYRSFQLFLFLASIATIYTSHLGGSITHGSDFLTEPLRAMQAQKALSQKQPQDLLVYEDLIHPTLENRCLSCHNDHKTKGGLLMTSLVNVQKGGKSGKPMFVANQPQSSELFYRITLPFDHEDHMPPKEKPALSSDEITLIHWWIQEGANPKMIVGLTPPDSIARLMKRYLPTLFRSQQLKFQKEKEQEKLSKELADFGKKIGLAIEPDREGFFGVSMQMPPLSITNKTVNKLMPYADLFSKISLPSSEITDESFYDFSRMSNLRALHLPKTGIKGNGLVYLKTLSKLEMLNLSHSLLNNEGILGLTQLPALNTVYLYDTKVDSLMLKSLEKHLPKIDFLLEEGPYY